MHLHALRLAASAVAVLVTALWGTFGTDSASLFLRHSTLSIVSGIPLFTLSGPIARNRTDKNNTPVYVYPGSTNENIFQGIVAKSDSSAPPQFSKPLGLGEEPMVCLVSLDRPPGPPEHVEARATGTVLVLYGRRALKHLSDGAAAINTGIVDGSLTLHVFFVVLGAVAKAILLLRFVRTRYRRVRLCLEMLTKLAMASALSVVSEIVKACGRTALNWMFAAVSIALAFMELTGQHRHRRPQRSEHGTPRGQTAVPRTSAPSVPGRASSPTTTLVVVETRNKELLATPAIDAVHQHTQSPSTNASYWTPASSAPRGKLPATLPPVRDDEGWFYAAPIAQTSSLLSSDHASGTSEHNNYADRASRQLPMTPPVLPVSIATLQRPGTSAAVSESTSSATPDQGDRLANGGDTASRSTSDGDTATGSPHATAASTEDDLLNTSWEGERSNSPAPSEVLEPGDATDDELPFVYPGALMFSEPATECLEDRESDRAQDESDKDVDEVFVYPLEDKVHVATPEPLARLDGSSAVEQETSGPRDGVTQSSSCVIHHLTPTEIQEPPLPEAEPQHQTSKTTADVAAIDDTGAPFPNAAEPSPQVDTLDPPMPVLMLGGAEVLTAVARVPSSTHTERIDLDDSAGHPPNVCTGGSGLIVLSEDCMHSQTTEGESGPLALVDAQPMPQPTEGVEATDSSECATKDDGYSSSTSNASPELSTVPVAIEPSAHTVRGDGVEGTCRCPDAEGDGELVEDIVSQVEEPLSPPVEHGDVPSDPSGGGEEDLLAAATETFGAGNPISEPDEEDSISSNVEKHCTAFNTVPKQPVQLSQVTLLTTQSDNAAASCSNNDPVATMAVLHADSCVESNQDEGQKDVASDDGKQAIDTASASNMEASDMCPCNPPLQGDLSRIDATENLSKDAKHYLEQANLDERLDLPPRNDPSSSSGLRDMSYEGRRWKRAGHRGSHHVRMRYGGNGSSRTSDAEDETHDMDQCIPSCNTLVTTRDGIASETNASSTEQGPELEASGASSTHMDSEGASNDTTSEGEKKPRPRRGKRGTNHRHRPSEDENLTEAASHADDCMTPADCSTPSVTDDTLSSLVLAVCSGTGRNAVGPSTALPKQSCQRDDVTDGARSVRDGDVLSSCEAEFTSTLSRLDDSATSEASNMPIQSQSNLVAPARSQTVPPSQPETNPSVDVSARAPFGGPGSDEDLDAGRRQLYLSIHAPKNREPRRATDASSTTSTNSQSDEPGKSARNDRQQQPSGASQETMHVPKHDHEGSVSASTPAYGAWSGPRSEDGTRSHDDDDPPYNVALHGPKVHYYPRKPKNKNKRGGRNENKRR